MLGALATFSLARGPGFGEHLGGTASMTQEAMSGSFARMKLRSISYDSRRFPCSRIFEILRQI